MELNTNQTRNFPLTYNTENNTVSVVFSTGARVLRTGNKPYFEELTISNDAIDFSRLNAGANIIDSHNTTTVRNVIGVVESAGIENGEAVARIRFSERDDVAGIVKDVRDGILKNISVGYSIQKAEKRGEESGYPIFNATRWMPAELSFVIVPADLNAQVRSEDLTEQQTIMEEGNKMEKETTVIEETRALPQINPDEVIRAERARIGEITKLCRSANLTSDFAEGLIGRGVEVSEARSLILDEVIKNQPKITQTTTVVDTGEKFRSGVENAIEIRAGFAKDDSKNEFRGMSLVEMGKRSLEIAGHSTSGSKLDIVGRAFTSTSDFPYILANLANKSLKRGYEEQATTWEKWTTVTSVADFKPQSFVSMSEFGLLDELPEGAEYKAGAFSEGKETVTIGTYGKMFVISRQAIINDDVGAFTRIPAAMGMAAKRTVNKTVYDKLFANPTLVTDNTAVFHANHSNLATGAISGGITVATLDAGRVAMSKQKDLAASAYLNIIPSVLLTPVGLSGTAKIIIGSQYDPDAANKLQRMNIAYNMAEVVSDPLLDGNSTTAWYLISKQYDSFIVGFLDGNQSPYIETQNLFNVDGLQTKVRLDWGVAAIDFRPVYKHAGA